VPSFFKFNLSTIQFVYYNVYNLWFILQSIYAGTYIGYIIAMLINNFNLVNRSNNNFFSEQSESRISCPNYCGRSYKNKQSLWRHLKFECGVQPQFICYICQKRFTDKQSMKRHVILQIHRHLNNWYVLNNNSNNNATDYNSIYHFYIEYILLPI